MVYSVDILNNSDLTMSMQTSAPSDSEGKMVSIFYNGSGLHKISGPTPYLDISTSVERNSLGMPEIYNTKITLNGTIVRTGADANMTSYGSGIGPVVSGIRDLYTIFNKDNDAGILEVFCRSGQNTVPLIAWTGVRIVSIDVPKNDNNWVFTADYTVVLEHVESAVSGCTVRSFSDSWNVEPLEDFLYTNTVANVLQKQEYHNPELKPTPPSEGNPQPQGTQTQNNQGAAATTNVNLNIISIPQYKISRTVSAVGVPLGSGQLSYNSAYLHAKMCVEKRLAQSFANTSSGTIRFGNEITTFTSNMGPVALLKDNGYLYNYVRTNSFNITEGSYEVTETYLAMPTGIGYTEDYTIEVSTDDRYIHTVRVQGEIRGLSLVPIELASGGALPLVSGLEPDKLYTNISLNEASGQMGGNIQGGGPLLLDNVPYKSETTLFYKNKYDNAASGWLLDIKPYLYRRACLGMNSPDRNRGYVNPASSPPKPPANPSYSTHGVLNIIPVNTSETHNPRKGTISYSYEFTNKFTMISGVIFENISIEDTGPTDVINEAFVLGRALGPVLQSLGTKTSSRKQISIEVGVVPPSSLGGFFMQKQECPLWTGGTVYTTITGLVEGFKPFGDRRSDIFGNVLVRQGIEGQVYVASDNQSWNPNEGRYSRTVSWIYQQCSNAKHYLDH
jgi:hypothetical protein